MMIASDVVACWRPVFKEVLQGPGDGREVFRISKVGAVAGCMVNDGSSPATAKCACCAITTVVHTGKVLSLKRFKNAASEVKAGFECGYLDRQL